VGHAWCLIESGADAGMLDACDLPELLQHLSSGRDVMWEELGFTFVGGVLSVCLLEDEAVCSVDALRSDLRRVEALLHGEDR
jgi:hypothetical protein